MVLFLARKGSVKINCLFACLYVRTSLIGRNRTSHRPDPIALLDGPKVIQDCEPESGVRFPRNPICQSYTNENLPFLEKISLKVTRCGESASGFRYPRDFVCWLGTNNDHVS